MSFLSRMSADLSNAVGDAFASVAYGDDAGKSAKLVFVARPSDDASPSPSSPRNGRRRDDAVDDGPSIDLGLTFLEVNGRAYVRTVDPNSKAANAGVRPRDAVQFAAVLGLSRSSPSRRKDGDDRGGGGPSDGGLPDGEDDGAAAKFALDREGRGLRTGYDELRGMLEGLCRPPRVLVDGDANEGDGGELLLPKATFESPGDERPKRRAIRRGVQSAVGRCAPKSARPDGEGDEESLARESRGSRRLPAVVLVFRRTRKRKSLLGGLAGGAAVGVPSFRLDDECDRASALVRRLAPAADATIDPPTPDAWDEMVFDGTEWLLGSSSILPGPPPLEGEERVEVGIGGEVAAGRGSPGRRGKPNGGNGATGADGGGGGGNDDPEATIPLDPLEADRSRKLATLRSRMRAEEALRRERAASSSAAASSPRSSAARGGPDDVEAATVRGMIQKAVGLAFVRASKVVLGVSLHGGSGIVVARLPDGTWSGPSAIGTWGLGLGLQFGLEVADYLFILQTESALEHFRRGGSFTIGGNVGAAVAGVGREAYGAASVGGLGCAAPTVPIEPDDDDPPQKTSEIAPVVAYAKSQGLYFGVSLEGSRIFSRDDINARAYKFATGAEVDANQILRGKVPTPPEAEDLYASLHSVEFTHEISGLPRPPELLRADAANPWRYDRSTLSDATADPEDSSLPPGAADPFSFLSNLTPEQSEEISTFEGKFKEFLYGGASVQRLVPPRADGGKVRRERRTLWLMLPEVGALRLGFLSKRKRSDGGGGGADNDNYSQTGSLDYTATVTSDDGDTATLETDGDTLGSTTVGGGGTVTDASDPAVARRIRSGNVNLSTRHSVALTDVTLLSQEPDPSMRFGPDDATAHLRVISVADCNGTTLLFLADNFREAELLVCGLKLLLERETARLGLRGGIPTIELGGEAVLSGGAAAASSPSSSRGIRDRYLRDGGDGDGPIGGGGGDAVRWGAGDGRLSSPRGGPSRPPGPSGYESSDLASEDESALTSTCEDGSSSVRRPNPRTVPEGRRSWSQIPGRHYLRAQASRERIAEAEEDSGVEADNDSRTASGGDGGDGGGGRQAGDGVPKYVHGQLLIRDVAANVPLPLPLPLCRVLFLDSSSPVISKWEHDRGDANFAKSDWTFPPSTPRELERHDSEHQLIASGSMMGAHRTIQYDRTRNGEVVHLAETQIVDADDPEKLAFTVTERMPRRGFSVKVRILLRAASTSNGCDATVLGEVRPMGKNMSNQLAVHKAFLLVVNEIKNRYGTEGKGLLAGFLNVANNFPSPASSPTTTTTTSRGSGSNSNSTTAGGETAAQHEATTAPFQQQRPSPSQRFPQQQQSRRIGGSGRVDSFAVPSTVAEQRQLQQRQQQQQQESISRSPPERRQQQSAHHLSRPQRPRPEQRQSRNSPDSDVPAADAKPDGSRSRHRQSSERGSGARSGVSGVGPPSAGAAPRGREGRPRSSGRGANFASFEEATLERNPKKMSSSGRTGGDRDHPSGPSRQSKPSSSSAGVARGLRESSRRNRERPSTPSMDLNLEPNAPPPQSVNKGGSKKANYPTNSFANLPVSESEEGNNSEDDGGPTKPAMTIEVKPLPKIRLSLMPAPREEDEDEDSSSKSPRKHRKSSRRKKDRSRRKSHRSSSKT